MIPKEGRADSQPHVVQPARRRSGAAKVAKGAHLIRGRTGPRTVRGKEKSSQNSVKHGIFSKVVLLPGESQVEFDALLRGLCEDFQPVGTFEDGLVEVLAVTRWRQRRLLIAEGAEIQAGREFIDWDVKQGHLDEATGFPTCAERCRVNNKNCKS